MKMDLIFKDGHVEECLCIDEDDTCTVFTTASGRYQATYQIVENYNHSMLFKSNIIRKWYKAVDGHHTNGGYIIPHWEVCNKIYGTMRYEWQCPCCGDYHKIEKISEFNDVNDPYKTYGFHCKNCHSTFTVDVSKDHAFTANYSSAVGTRSGGKTLAANYEKLKEANKNLTKENEALMKVNKIFIDAMEVLDGNIVIAKDSRKITCTNDPLKSYRCEKEHIEFLSNVMWGENEVNKVKEAITILPYNLVKKDK